MSRLFPQLDRRLVQRLLRNGMNVPVEQSALRQTTEALERLGLIAATHRQYVKCVNQNDEDYWNVTDRSCPGEIELEDDSSHDCPDCGRTIDYPAVRKEVFEELCITVRPEGTTNYLFTALCGLDIVDTLETKDHIAARAHLSDGRVLIVPVVDYAGIGWRARGRDAQRVHAYAIVSPVNRPSHEHLERAYHFELADVLANDQEWLAEVIDAAARPRNTAFISYSPQDASFVDRLAEDLVANGVGVWLDRWEIRVGDSITDRIQEGLLESDYLLVVLSPNSVNSPWVREELNAARIEQLESRRVVVLPVLYQDLVIPPLLKDKRYADCRGGHYEQGVQELLAVLAPPAAFGPSPPAHWGQRPSAVSRIQDRDQTVATADRTSLLKESVAQIYALFVGIAKYRQLRHLSKTTIDARDLHDLLADSGYPEMNRALLLDGEATKAAISDRLDWLARRAGPDDTVLVFFSGHGAQRIGGFEPGEYLCPLETDWYNLRGTAISDEEFSTALQAINAGRMAVFLDACHSGGVGAPRDAGIQVKSGLSESAYLRLTAGRGRVVIASCRPDEESWELSGMRNGLFTHYMLEGLRGAAAGPDGVVRILDLFHYVSQKVPQKKDQHPLFKGELETSFPIVVVREL